MPQSLSNRTSLKRTYERTLLSLLDADGPAMQSSDSDACLNSESKLFEKDLERLLREGNFALEMLEHFLLEDVTNHHRNDPPSTGFHRLMSECQKFLVRSRTTRFLLSGGGELVSMMVDAGFRSEGVNRKPEYGEKRRPMDDNDDRIELRYEDHVTFGADDNVKTEADDDVKTKADDGFKTKTDEDIKTKAEDDVKRKTDDDFKRKTDDGVKINADEGFKAKADDSVKTKTDDGNQAMDLVQASRCLAGLITATESQSFESLLASVCFRRNPQTNRPLGLLILESILATNGIQDAADLRNLRLGFGETPLVLAVRARDPDVVLSLLRHGADTARGWMGFTNALEVLLFSPNQVFLEPDDIEAVERCLEYLLRAMRSVDLGALGAKEAGGYYALLPHWRRALPAAMERSWRSDSIPVPSLQHLCRCVVRQSMSYLGHRLPEGLNSLPLPVVIRQFLRI